MSTSQLIVIFEDDETFSNWSPAFGVTYALNDNTTLYAKYVTGFKAGGFNENAGIADDMPLGEEESEGVEVGSNLSLFDGTTALRIAAYAHERTDTVIATDDPSFPVGTNLIGASGADVDTWGAELELSSQPMEGLEINAAVGYLDTEYKSFDSTIGDFTGNEIPLVYDWTGSLQATYRHSLGSSELSMFYYGLYTLKYDGWLDDANTMEADDVDRINLKIGVEGGSWRAIAYVDNATDEVDIAYQNPRNQFRTYTPGRTYGLQLAMDF